MSLFRELQSGTYSAISNGKILYSGGSRNLISFIAHHRAAGNEVEVSTDGVTPEEKRRRILYLENCITVEPVGFRLLKIDTPGMYSGPLFASESDAIQYRVDFLNDLMATEHKVVECDWREARL
jgi:hypothetical protein